MGDLNSSVTRVWPILVELMCRQREPVESLRLILKLAFRNSGNELSEQLCDSSQPILSKLLEKPASVRSLYELEVTLPACFEYSLPPSERFLLWLIERAGEECKPRKGLRQEQLIAGRRADRFGDDATLRQEAQREAIRSLMLHGPRKSRNQWWALEGFTSVDCYLETSDMVLLIEGKRTESVSSGTDWCATRNQVARNLEAAMNAAQGRRYAVLLLGEQQTPVGREEIVAGLPHMTALESSFLSQHYLGCVTWQQVCKASGLTIDLNRELGDVRMAEKWLRNRGYMAKLGE